MIKERKWDGNIIQLKEHKHIIQDILITQQLVNIPSPLAYMCGCLYIWLYICMQVYMWVRGLPLGCHCSGIIHLFFFLRLGLSLD